jgi:hypothetical protein
MLESPSWAQTIAAVILRFQVLGRIKRSDGRPKYDQAENEPGHWGVLIAPVPEYLENGGADPGHTGCLGGIEADQNGSSWPFDSRCARGCQRTRAARVARIEFRGRSRAEHRSCFS